MTVAGTRLGPVFGGVGAISGGGGNSRYVIDYPPRQRAAILDYLFRPRYGAALQLLKIEIGGNGNSSDGSEPSIEQTPGRVDCHVGYELWLAQQALRRNPAIELYGLQWSAPRWVRSRAGTLWTAADIRYLLDWLGCARRAGLPISYLGGWNEHYTPRSAAVEGWYIALRHALDAHGYRRIRIVASDAAGFANATVWSVAGDMAANPAFARAVAVIGVHDVCGLESHAARCSSTPAARRFSQQSGKPLWQSEFGRTPTSTQGPLEEGPAGLARALDNEYIDAGITGVLLWPLVDAMPAGLPFSNRGLITADQPWSGSYRVNPLTWVVAHTTQFTRPGWRFVDGADGRLPDGTSYVTYAAPDRAAWTMVVQTSTATRARRLRVHLTGGLPRAVHAWVTQLHGPAHLVDLGSLTVARGWWSYELAPGAVYTFTSTTGQTDAGGDPPPIPPAAPLALPYGARPDGAGMAALLSPMEGSFGYVHGRLTQTTVGAPVPWIGCDVEFPYAVVGAPHWRDYTVAATVRLPSPPAPAVPGAMLIARFSGFREPCEFNGYDFSLSSTGSWRVVRNGHHPTLLAAGHVRPGRRYRMTLGVSGSRLTAGIDGRQVASIVDTVDRSGLAGIGANGFDAVEYTNLTVR